MTALKTTIHNGIGSLSESYCHLFEKSCKKSLFLSLPWFLNLERTVLSPHVSQIYTVEEDSGRGIAALMLQRQKHSFGPLRLVALESLANYYTCRYEPLFLDESLIDPAAAQLASSLWKERHRWDCLKLQPIERDSKIFVSLVDTFKQAGMVV